MNLADLSLDLDREDPLLEGVNARLVSYVNEKRSEISKKGYSIGLETDIANRAVHAFPRIWELRKYPLSVENLVEIQPRLVEMVLSLDLLRDVTVASRSPVTDKRVKFINACVATPLEYINALRSYHANVELIGAENDDGVKKALLDKYVPVTSPFQPTAEISTRIIGGNAAAENVFERNMVERGVFSAKQLNELISERVKKLHDSADRKNILGLERKRPRTISEYCWTTMMHQDAKLKGLRFPLYEDGKEGVEIAQVIYAGPNEALKFITSDPFVSGLANYFQYIYHENQNKPKKFDGSEDELEEPCILEILLGIISADGLRQLSMHKRELLRRAANNAMYA